MRERLVPDIYPSNGVENWSTFGKKFETFAPKWKRRIELAYDWAVDIHSGYFRKDGKTPFFEHPKAVTLILLEEVGIRDPNILIAALMHDTVEDSHFFGNANLLPYSVWIKTARTRLKPVFGPTATDFILALTKPKIDKVEIKDKKEAMEKYFDNLSGNRGAALIKMADRLHNLRDFVSLTKEERERIIKETETQYFSLFDKVKWTYPKEHDLLVKRIREAISDVRSQLVNDEPIKSNIR